VRPDASAKSLHGLDLSKEEHIERALLVTRSSVQGRTRWCGQPARCQSTCTPGSDARIEE